MAESLAADYLVKHGFTIKARNYRYRHAEVDLIVQRHRLLVFVEVKARSSDQFGEPETFVTPKQQTRVHAAATQYIMAQNWAHAIRFDIVAIHLKSGRGHHLTHFEDAF